LRTGETFSRLQRTVRLGLRFTCLQQIAELNLGSSASSGLGSDPVLCIHRTLNSAFRTRQWAEECDRLLAGNLVTCSYCHHFSHIFRTHILRPPTSSRTSINRDHRFRLNNQPQIPTGIPNASNPHLSTQQRENKNSRKLKKPENIDEKEIYSVTIPTAQQTTKHSPLNHPHL